MTTTRFVVWFAFVDVVALVGPVCPVACSEVPDTTLQARAWKAAYEILLQPDELSVLDTCDDSQEATLLELFWKKRDATPTTERNEFREQFTDRVETALIKFRSVSNRAPWDQRGEVYIKFGEPDDIIEKDSGAFIRFEKWHYFGRNRKLLFRDSRMESELVPLREGTGKSESLARFADLMTQLDTTGVAYELPVGVQEIAPVLACYPFRRVDGLYEVYLADATPLKQLLNFTTWQGGEVNYKARVMAFDSTLATKWSDSVQVAQHFDVLPRGMLAQNQWETVLRPGFYVFTSEIVDSAGKKHGVASFDRWLAPYLDSVELDLSPLVIAADVREADENSDVFVRNGKEIIPMPGHVFKKDQDVAFYHEVYNLKPDETGLCRYRIEYALYNRKKNDRRPLLSRDFESTERQTFQAGRVPQRLLGKGSYILEVKTTDLHSTKTKTALAQFKVE